MSEPKVELPRSFGSYSLLKLLARGGMGEIYLARTAGITGFEKYYAVKKLLKKFTHDNDVGARFVDEAKLGARLQHPNIVQVYDLGRVSDELYMATEFVDGFDLRRVLRFCHEKKKRIPLDIALFIVREVLSGLAYAHRQVDAEGQSINLIHRDISPQNVLVSFEGEVKIIDFGLAKSTQRSQETQANVLLGNFGYMSPEQARGQILDVRTDVYSCGIVLFELVTGTKRFVEENPLKLLEMVARPTPIVPSDRVPSSPKAIDKIYVHATAQDKEQRYASAEAFRDDVTTALHRLNPRASRENLAQFLNHLFLGGQAPPTVDDNVLNKSVVLAARDLHAGAVSLGGESAADDVKNRSLGQVFGDDAPQTASHPLLRTARVGDILSHDAITGEASPSSARPASSSPPMQVASLDDRSSEQPLEEMSLESAPNLDESDLNSAFESLGLTAQIKNDVRTNEGTSSSQDGAVLSADDEPQGPTRVYDSPSWPSTSTVAEPTQATESREKSLERRAQLDVQLQLEQQAAEAEVQRQLEAQADLQAQMQAQLEAQLEQQLQTQTKEAAKEAARQQAAQAAQAAAAAAQAQAAEQARQAQARQLEQASRQQALAQQLDEMTQVAGPPPPRAPSRRMNAVAAPGSVDSAIVITPVGGPVGTPIAKPKKPSSPPTSVETPSIVISADLEAEAVESDVGATMRNPRASGGFGDGGHHESLIIDFEQEAEASEEELPLVEGTAAQPIRPAARPVGKPVVPAVAAAKARRPSEEGPPSTMPPPTRRR